jgi:hypothetical protein
MCELSEVMKYSNKAVGIVDVDTKLTQSRCSVFVRKFRLVEGVVDESSDFSDDADFIFFSDPPRTRRWESVGL